MTRRGAETLTQRELWEALGISRASFYRLKAQGVFERLESPVPHRYSRVKVAQFIHSRAALLSELPHGR